MSKTADSIIGIVRDMKPSSSPVCETDHLYTRLGFDSLEFVALLARVEESLSISIGLMEMESCLHLDRLIALAEAKTKER